MPIALFLLLALFTGNAAAEIYAVVPKESRIDFVVKEMGVPVPGTFSRFDATADIDAARPDQASAQVTIDIGSLSTGNPEADAIAVNADWLDKASSPQALFRSKSMRPLAPDRYELRGTLTIRGTSRDMTVQVTRGELPAGKMALTGDFSLKRSDFGVGGGEWNQGGVVAEDIAVNVRLTLARADGKTTPTVR